MNENAIDVCVCTYRRPSLIETLRSIAAQNLPAGVNVRVIVADNDAASDRRAEIVLAGEGLGLDLLYVHAPDRNISIARNACLAAATAPWIAFIDDDEIAQPDWLANLFAQSANSDVVFGVSQAHYSSPACPRWIAEGDFHSNRLQGNDPGWSGYTANVLIRHDLIVRLGLRFALELGQVGGEDTMLFFQAHVGGARFAYAPLAIVDEDTPGHRATLRWLLRRRYRSGQVHFMVLQRQGQGRAKSLIGALAKAIYCLGIAPASARAGVVGVMASILRAALHLGVVTAALGAKPVLEYGGADAARP